MRSTPVLFLTAASGLPSVTVPRKAMQTEFSSSSSSLWEDFPVCPVLTQDQDSET